MGFGKVINKMPEVVWFVSSSLAITNSLVYSFIFSGYRCIFFLSFDELLELSQRGNNRVIDMLVGDIYGGMDYSKVYSSPFFNL